jgi:RNA polymerase sigma-70 factor, ECF subfamily
VSTPLQGRELAFPTIWAKNQARSASVPELSVVRCPSDEEVMTRLNVGDSNALHFLFDRYARLTLSIAHRILRDQGEAEELVQEVFFQVFQKANLFDSSKGTARAWIMQITIHRALDRKSYLNRRGFYLGADIGCVHDTLVGNTDLDRELGAKLNRVQLEKAFKDLSEMQRRTLELFFFEGLEIREIIEKLKEPLGNVRHHLYRGLEQLRKSAFVQKLRDR